MYSACDTYPAGGACTVDPGADEGRDGGDEPLEAWAKGDPAGYGDIVAVERRIHHVQVDDVQFTWKFGQ